MPFCKCGLVGRPVPISERSKNSLAWCYTYSMLDLLRERSICLLLKVSAMIREALPQVARNARTEDGPMTVREAATYLGVSPQTVYLWVERKQIPHLRVMGRNIRFLKSDLEPFRASFKQEMANG
jgi:excisionase family DNA binding protein